METLHAPNPLPDGAEPSLEDAYISDYLYWSSTENNNFDDKKNDFNQYLQPNCESTDTIELNHNTMGPPQNKLYSSSTVSRNPSQQSANSTTLDSQFPDLSMVTPQQNTSIGTFVHSSNDSTGVYTPQAVVNVVNVRQGLSIATPEYANENINLVTNNINPFQAENVSITRPMFYSIHAGQTNFQGLDRMEQTQTASSVNSNNIVQTSLDKKRKAKARESSKRYYHNKTKQNQEQAIKIKQLEVNNIELKCENEELKKGKEELEELKRENEELKKEKARTVQIERKRKRKFSDLDKEFAKKDEEIRILRKDKEDLLKHNDRLFSTLNFLSNVSKKSSS